MKEIWVYGILLLSRPGEHFMILFLFVVSNSPTSVSVDRLCRGQPCALRMEPEVTLWLPIRHTGLISQLDRSLTIMKSQLQEAYISNWLMQHARLHAHCNE